MLSETFPGSRGGLVRRLGGRSDRCLTHVLSPAFFGAGTGVAVAKLWGVRKIREFECSDGRRVLRSPRRSPWDRSIPSLYAAEVP